jgi:hypothetical protein
LAHDEETGEGSSSKNIEVLILAGAALVTTVVVGMVARNTVDAHPEIRRQSGWGDGGFAASQQKQQEAIALPSVSSLPPNRDFYGMYGYIDRYVNA